MFREVIDFVWEERYKACAKNIPVIFMEFLQTWPDLISTHTDVMFTIRLFCSLWTQLLIAAAVLGAFPDFS